MKTERFSAYGSSRYEFDKKCSWAKGWAQVDTSQDAHYFGTWVHPHELKIVTYCEGDVTIQTAESKEEFVAELRRIKEWNTEQGHRFIGLDAGCIPITEANFSEMGLADMLH